jgi:hypothetical protein
VDSFIIVHIKFCGSVKNEMFIDTLICGFYTVFSSIYSTFNIHNLWTAFSGLIVHIKTNGNLYPSNNKFK